MPTWDKILKEIDSQKQFHIGTLEKYICEMQEINTGRTVICYMTAFSVIRLYKIPMPFHSIIDQDMQGFMTCSQNVNKEGLDLILHLPGGDFEATKRIISYLHSTYKHIRVFVPHMAMSGGTLISCAADEIYMGPYSSLGPTDPQVFLNNKFVPIHAIIKEFERAFKEVKKDPKRAILWNERLKLIPFGIRESVETMNDNSQKYLEWLLVQRNCPKKSPTDIHKIASYLNNMEKHSSHGEGIDLKKADELGLNVKDLHEDKKLEDAVLSIYHTASIIFEQTPMQKIIANHDEKRYINNYSSPNN